MPSSGVAVYNPATLLAAVADANEVTYVSTTFSSTYAAGQTSINVTSATGLSVDQFIQLGPNGSGAEIVQVTAISTNTLTVYPATAKAHTSGDAVVAKVQRQIVTVGGAQRTILTSGSATTATNVKSTPGVLVGFYNTGPALTVYLQLYDSSSTTVSQATCIFGDGTSATALGAGQVVMLGLPLANGLAYVLSGALPATANIILIYA